MEYAQLIAGLIQLVRGLLKGTVAWAQAEALLSKIDANLTTMQAEGNRAPNDAERAEIAGILDELAKLPAQG